MPPALSLPFDRLAETVGEREFGVYLHVPFCRSRCGYCDFNTYTSGELGGRLDTQAYLAAVRVEVERARELLPSAPPVATVFVGGGTPTILPPEELGLLVEEVGAAFGLAEGAEVTVEANPETVDEGVLRRLRRAGFTRVSLGMQSAAPHVLAFLDREHTPRRAEEAARQARAAGFERVSLDLIYGTPGETAEDWARSLEAVVSAGVDHVSAYGLVVEAGTRLGRRVARGEAPAPEDDRLAERYLAAEEFLAAEGFSWYEISNWARDPESRCRHNDLYWRSQDWWGLGPGAHSHVGGVRWWNVKHPARYGEALAGGGLPVDGYEVLDEAERHLEAVMLGLRRVEGVPLGVLTPRGRRAAEEAARSGLVVEERLAAGFAALTLRGRLLTDTVTRALTE